MQDVTALRAFFQPKSVAIVGASSDPGKTGNKAFKEDLLYILIPLPNR